MKIIKKYINKIGRLFGLSVIKISNWRPLSDFEKLNEPSDILSAVRKNTMLISELRLINIRESVNYVHRANIGGSYVECGVWKGGSVAYAAFCLKKISRLVPLHLFDSFDDICQPDAKIDGNRAIKDVGGIQNANGELTPVKGVYNRKGGHGKEMEVCDLISQSPISYPNQLINIHKGWFQDTLPKTKDLIGPIAILRLDGDWYSSTKVCLEFLYPNVQSGGVVIVDDYGCYEGCKKAVDEYLDSIGCKPFFFKIDDECICFVKK